MKAALKLAVFTLALFASGCKLEEIDAPQQSTDKPVRLEAFNDKTYIWQSWTISTNDVDMSMLQ